MKEKIAMWIMNSITSRVNPQYLNKYKFASESCLDSVLVGMLCTTLSMIAYLFGGPTLLVGVVIYLISLVAYACYKYYEILIDLTTQAKAVQDAMESGNLDFSKMLSDPEFGKMVSELKQKVESNNKENDDFLKEIEKNIGKF